MTVYAVTQSRTIQVADLSLVGAARRAATDLANDLGFTETKQGNLAIVVTEAATNLVQHAGGGQVIMQGLRIEGADWIEVIAIDKGPGMADVNRCLQDGYSTAGTRGQGLGAIVRLSDLFDVYSIPRIGTALVARICSKPVAPGFHTAAGDSSPLLAGAVNVPKPGEHESGDSWAVCHQPDRSLVMMVDGLGHGPLASEAALEARRVFLENVSADLLDILDRAHSALHKTRGAAMAVAEVRIDQRLVRFAGVGNIAGTIWSAGNVRSMVSYNGIIGHEVRKLRDFAYPFPQGSLLMMYSDGLNSHCNFDAFPGLAARHPTLVAAMFYRDCARGRDDASIFVTREP